MEAWSCSCRDRGLSTTVSQLCPPSGVAWPPATPARPSEAPLSGRLDTPTDSVSVFVLPESLGSASLEAWTLDSGEVGRSGRGQANLPALPLVGLDTSSHLPLRGGSQPCRPGGLDTRSSCRTLSLVFGSAPLWGGLDTGSAMQRTTARWPALSSAALPGWLGHETARDTAI